MTQRVRAAFGTRPTLQDVGFACALMAGFAAVVLPLGFATGFLSAAPVEITPARVLLVFQLLLMPALMEEIVFRVLPFPHKTESVARRGVLVSSVAALIVFVVYHPLNALTFYKVANPTFFHPVFLMQTALLGAICTVSYRKSGSIYPAVLTHWIVVVVWLFLLGGLARLGG